MKKKVFGLLLVVAMLCALCVMAVSAAETDIDFSAGGTVNATCQHCNAKVDWLPFTQAVSDAWGTDYNPADGTHYYVAEETVEVKLVSIAAAEQLCLHLNGNTVRRNSTNARPFSVNGKMAIMDHAANEGVIAGYGKSDSTGCVIRLNSKTAEVDLYGGTLKMLAGTTTSTATAKAGGVVFVYEQSTFTMHGGVITGGMANTGGANIYTDSGNVHLLGGTVEGGNASSCGGNVYCGGTLVLGNCNITGGTAGTGGSDVYLAASGKLEVKKEFAGNVRMALNAAHLPATLEGGVLAETLDSSEGAFPGKLMLEAAGELYTVTGKDGDTKLYLSAFQVEDVDFSAGGVVNGWCQKCQTYVDWKPLTEAVSAAWGTNYSTAGGTHYYVAEESVKMAGGCLSLADNENLCLHLNGNTLYRSGPRAFNVNGAALSIMDHEAGGGVLSAFAESSSTGCVVRLSKAAAVLNLYGGTLKMNTGSHTRAEKGGTVYMIESSTFNMYGGNLTGGKAKNGGNLYVDVKGTFTMTGGTIENGVAINSDGSTGLGGNIYLNSSTVVNISDATLTGGTAAERGGNLVTTATNIKLTIKDSVISNGSCEKAGGNLYLNNGNITITDTVITGGTAGTSGGNIITKVGASLNTNTILLDGCTVTDGTAGTYGGNVMVEGHSTGTATLTFGDNTVTGGTAGTMGDNIYVASTGKLAITKDFAGETSVRFHGSHLPQGVRGGTIVNGATCEGPFAGTLLVENDGLLPQAYGKENDTTLYIKAAAIAKADGTAVWYDSNEAAVAAYDETAAYLAANAGDLALTGGAYIVDLGGGDLNVTGTGSVTFFDSANQDLATYGTATVTGVTVNNEFATEQDGVTYYMVQEGDQYSFHCAEVKLTNVNLRIETNGIYYTGVWSCDEKLATLVDTYGVATSAKKMPKENFETRADCLYTAYEGKDLENGIAKNGVIIENVIKDTDSADAVKSKSSKPVYAAAYLKFKNGTVALSGENAAYSMEKVMTQLDQLLEEEPVAYRDYLRPARNFYESWKDKGLDGWNLKTIPFPEKVEDGVLNLLMVGNSFCYYYVEELYELLMENPPEGITEVNIYNVYHSGCKVDTHYEKWINNEAHYTIFKTDANGRRALTEEYEGTLEQALALEDNWDYISLQGTVANSSYLSQDPMVLAPRIAEAAEPLLDRFYDLYPHAQLLWHRTWFFEVGRVSSGYTYTAADGPIYEANMQKVCDYMCTEFDKDKPYDLMMVNSGKAWVPVREQAADLLPFGGLCARLGYSAYGEDLAGYTGVTTHSGDGYHEGDIGGAQLLNAYSWYEAITGKDCRELTYRPVYTYSGNTYTLAEELVKIMQNSAHIVGEEMRQLQQIQPAS